MSNLNDQLKDYWKNKLGKHDESLMIEHGKEIESFCIVDSTDLFEQLNKNEYHFKNDDIGYWKDFLRKANISEYMKIQYVKDALDVTTHQPAIGKGEFLFVSCFKNLAFNKESGDLIDLSTKDKIEFKGNRSTIAGDGSIGYKPLTREMILSIDKVFGLGHNGTFNKDLGELIDKKYKQNPNIEKIKKALEILQNLENYSEGLTDLFSKLYLSKKNFFLTVAAMHMFAYLKLQKANYLVMTNDESFRVFKAPSNPEEAYTLVSNLKVETWSFNKKGISVSL